MNDIDWSSLILDKNEAATRGVQIKYMLGIKDKTPITAEHLKYLKENIILFMDMERMFMDMNNTMKEFLDSITDFDKAAAWLSKNAYSLGAAMNLLGIIKHPRGAKGF